MTRAPARVLITNFGMHTVAPPATAVVRAASPSCPNAGEAQEFTSVCGSSGDCWLSLWTPRRITMKRRPLFYNGRKQGGRQWRTDRGVRSRAALRWRPGWRALERLRLAVRRRRRQRQEPSCSCMVHGTAGGAGAAVQAAAAVGEIRRAGRRDHRLRRRVGDRRQDLRTAIADRP